jgi:FlgD Ig-like domain
MSMGGHLRAVTGTAIALIVLGFGLVLMPFAQPTPDPVRIEGTASAGHGARVDLRVTRRGRLSVAIRTSGGDLLRVLLPEQAISPGSLSVEWDGRFTSGVDVPPGAYVVQATAYPGLRPFVVERRIEVGA